MSQATNSLSCVSWKHEDFEHQGKLKRTAQTTSNGVAWSTVVEWPIGGPVEFDLGIGTLLGATEDFAVILMTHPEEVPGAQLYACPWNFVSPVASGFDMDKTIKHVPEILIDLVAAHTHIYPSDSPDEARVQAVKDEIDAMILAACKAHWPGQLKGVPDQLKAELASEPAPA